ncbi:penicillin-binding protein activator LpoB [Photobacterium sp. SDRW27]|uniref:penicillin-binding protein activator LpoB n=1 Tax=Photobacterium obscurum TaxID=2829490 RepID=UPI0022435089|nr:penicillin-binding protein activator LpoB [Photobacterium obscurum]MCW8332115.1 penicillin-binding protein activator LpoB [Photobacterium obscurum]
MIKFCKTGTAAVVAGALLMGGCQTTTQYIDSTDQTKNITAGLSNADFEKAADDAVSEMMASPLLVHPNATAGGRYVIAVSEVTNDTMQRISTEQIAKKIRVQLLKTGKFLATSAIGATKDKMVVDVRNLQESSVVNKQTAKGNNVVMPDFALSGKIIQANNRLDNGDQRVEYYFQLTLTNLENGLAYFESETVIGKVTDGSTVTW